MKPKAEWERHGAHWAADVGPYTFLVSEADGHWQVSDDGWNHDIGEGTVSTPCDVVTLMLAAEEALRAHLVGVAESMRWPTEESGTEEEAPAASLVSKLRHLPQNPVPGSLVVGSLGMYYSDAAGHWHKVGE